MTSDISITTCSHKETSLFGELLGEVVPKGTVLTLEGDLGSGKTTLVQGLAKGLGVSDTYYITSPTYTLIHEYTGKCRFFHVDLYRLTNLLELEELGLEEILSGDAVVAIEWPDRLPRNYPATCLSIKLDTVDEDIRRIIVSLRGLENQDLIGEIEKKLKERKWR
ncbi:MAG: tRNA (adenosine(37)-N6)-threonylcarbamoyltransferase complex ATPase subunit type 1 TsaE [Desulfobacterales bacterium]